MSISIFFIFPILMILMFMLGLELNATDFVKLRSQPKAILVGLFGQIIGLPLTAYFICILLNLPFSIAFGLMLIACSPGGNTSNVLSLLAKGNAALSVVLTILSSFIAIVSIPFILKLSIEFLPISNNINITVPIKNIMLQNLLLTVFPLSVGMLTKHYKQDTAKKLHLQLKRFAYPLLILFILMFLAQFFQELKQYIIAAGFSVFLLIIGASALAWVLAKLFHLKEKEKRTIHIEIGIQNVALSMALATSPFVFNELSLTIPSIVYAFFMNFIVLIYVKIIGKRKPKNT